MLNVETIASILAGLGLAAACGMRVFLPLLALGVATRAGIVEPGAAFAWVGSWPAIIGLGAACVAEIAGYYVPIVDHALDAIASPAALIAGALVTMANITSGDGSTGLLGWSAAAVAGAGVAGAVKAVAATTRIASTTTTAATANPIVATIENAGAAVVSIVAIVAPIMLAVAALLVVLGGVVLWRKRQRRRSERLVTVPA